MARSENRLTDSDRDRMALALRHATASWPRGYVPAVGIDDLAMVRVAAHSLGCSTYDLRESEVEEITASVHAHFAAMAAGR